MQFFAGICNAKGSDSSVCWEKGGRENHCEEALLCRQTDRHCQFGKESISEQRSKKKKPQVEGAQVPDKGNTPGKWGQQFRIHWGLTCVSSMRLYAFKTWERFRNARFLEGPCLVMYQVMGGGGRKQPEKFPPSVLIVQFLLALLGACKMQITGRGTLPSPVLHTSTHGCSHTVAIVAMQVGQNSACSQLLSVHKVLGWLLYKWKGLSS